MDGRPQEQPAPSHEGVRGARKNMMALARGSTPNHRHLRDRLAILWAVIVVLDLVFSVIAHLLETGRPGSDLHNYGDALFWTTTQMLTISSSLANPVTGWGQVLDVVIECIGITIITAQAGTLGSFLYRHSVELSPPAQLRHLQAISEELAERALQRSRAEDAPPSPKADT